MASSNGLIESPWYPSLYSNDLDCVWVITVQPGFKVYMTFDAVRIENEASCGFDAVEVFDSSEVNDAYLIGRYVLVV